MAKVRFWIPVLAWAGVIFSFSSLSVSPASEIYWQDFIVKKTAHLFEYSLLFVLTYRALLNTSSWSRKKVGLVSLIFIFMYAVSDEYHQSFTPGREPKLRDVIIDTTAGIIVWTLIAKYLLRAPKRLKDWAAILQIV